MRHSFFAALCLAVTCFSTSVLAKSSTKDPRLGNAYRFERGGWIYVHLEGSPTNVGYQHGYLLAPEIEDALKAVKLFDTHTSERDWGFFRKTAREVLWPHIEA